MKKNTKTVLIVTILIASLMLTACGQTQSPSDASFAGTNAATGADAAASGQAQSSGEQASASDENAIYGEVTAINGSEITISVGTLNQQARPSGDQQGTMPSGEGGNKEQMGQNPPDSNASGQPSGGQPGDGQMPQGSGENGAQPSGNQEGRSMLTLTGETKTITVTDESVITTPSFNREQNGQESASASAEASASAKTGLAAIQTGSTIKIVYDSDNTTIKSITVMNGFGGRGNGPGGQGQMPDASAAASASAT